jgi:hypothetical protein
MVALRGWGVTPRRVGANANHPSASQRSDRPLLGLHELLLEVSRRPTRLELLCWELNIDESRARQAWDGALRIKLLKEAGVDRHNEAKLFALTDRGRHALRELSGRRRKRRKNKDARHQRPRHRARPTTGSF